MLVGRGIVFYIVGWLGFFGTDWVTVIYKDMLLQCLCVWCGGEEEGGREGEKEGKGGQVFVFFNQMAHHEKTAHMYVVKTYPPRSSCSPFLLSTFWNCDF